MGKSGLDRVRKSREMAIIGLRNGTYIPPGKILGNSQKSGRRGRESVNRMVLALLASIALGERSRFRDPEKGSHRAGAV